VLGAAPNVEQVRSNSTQVLCDFCFLLVKLGIFQLRRIADAPEMDRSTDRHAALPLGSAFFE
jgi:hypothetical protein